MDVGAPCTAGTGPEPPSLRARHRRPSSRGAPGRPEAGTGPTPLAGPVLSCAAQGHKEKKPREEGSGDGDTPGREAHPTSPASCPSQPSSGKPRLHLP